MFNFFKRQTAYNEEDEYDRKMKKKKLEKKLERERKRKEIEEKYKREMAK
jgi:hypothetical protein